MAVSLNGSSFLHVANRIYSAMPFSVSCLYYSNRTTNPSNEIPLCFVDTGTNAKYDFRLTHDAATLYAYQQYNGGTYDAGTAASIVLKQWCQIGARWTSTTSRNAILRGGVGSTNTGSVTDPTSFLDRFCIGELYNAYGRLTGFVAEVGIWSIALSASDFAALSAGWIPPLIRPDALLAYYPLLADYRDYWKSGYHLSSSGSPTIVAHPPGLIYPRRRAA